MTDVKTALKEFPEKAGKHWLFWLSMAALGLTIAHTLRKGV